MNSTKTCTNGRKVKNTRGQGSAYWVEWSRRNERGDEIEVRGGREDALLAQNTSYGLARQTIVEHDGYRRLSELFWIFWKLSLFFRGTTYRWFSPPAKLTILFSKAINTWKRTWKAIFPSRAWSLGSPIEGFLFPLRKKWACSDSDTRINMTMDCIDQ